MDSRSISATVNDPERPPTTLSFQLCHMETKQDTSGDCQRLAVSKFGAKSGNLNEDFERLSTTLKGRHRLAVIPNDPDTPVTAKDRQRHSATDNNHMESGLN